jgi:hypothetical protein
VPNGYNFRYLHDGLIGVDFVFEGAQLRAISFRASNPEPIPCKSIAKFLICPVASRCSALTSMARRTVTRAAGWWVLVKRMRFLEANLSLNSLRLLPFTSEDPMLAPSL